MNTPTLPPDSASHRKDLVDSMAILAELTNRLEKLETELNRQYIDVVDEHRREFLKLDEGIRRCDATIRDIAGLHPEWFAETKTLTTPYGSVRSTSVTKLSVPSPDVTIQLLKQLLPNSEPFLRVNTELNLEALEILTDAELARVRVERVTTESLSIKITKPNLGKAKKEASKRKKSSEGGEP